ncbi:glycosyltransferase family 4 protein [Hymenobacter terricola]|uniref:glycosyltransferase family 4 protein n=1 Tax=Hymenobacter terricola TaxID=2819236 RepID=UPI001B31210C|nr:glycosyltransferase family 1 protein [Hymenobacter terricola]
MNILLYIPKLDQSHGGVRQYSIALMRILAQDKHNTYFVYHNGSDQEVLSSLAVAPHLHRVMDSDVAKTTVQAKIIRGKQIINFLSRRFSTGWQFKIDSLIDRLIHKYKIDIIHCPYQFIPLTNNAKLIVTLHDVQEIHFPDFFTAEDRAYRAVNFLDFLRRADEVVVSYRHIKNDLVKYFAIPPDKIQVVLLDMGKLWFERFTEADVLSLSELNLPSPFIFYPANTWKHKNHSRLLRALALLRDEYGCRVNLICSGHLNEHYEESLSMEMDELNLHDQVRFLGIVDEQSLFSLYRHCLGVVVPTVYEAGSFPLMESILLKVPVICSSVTSLPETVDNPDFLFDPFDAESMAAKIKLLWTSEEFRQLSVANSNTVGWKLKHTRALEKLLSLYSGL